jgi:hypothetical protein
MLHISRGDGAAGVAAPLLLRLALVVVRGWLNTL